MPKPRIEESVGIQVENQVSADPAANRRTFGVRFVEAELAHVILQECEVGVGADGNNCIHIEGGPHGSGGGIGQQQSCYTAADEDNLIEQRLQLRCGGSETRNIRVPGISVHLESILAANSRMAISRSRARPSRMASTSARSS